MPLAPLNLQLTMLSGQTPSFMWHFENGKFSRAWNGKIIEVSQEKGKLKTNNKNFKDFLENSEVSETKVYLIEVQEFVKAFNFLFKA